MKTDHDPLDDFTECRTRTKDLEQVTAGATGPFAEIAVAELARLRKIEAAARATIARLEAIGSWPCEQALTLRDALAEPTP